MLHMEAGIYCTRMQGDVALGAIIWPGAQAAVLLNPPAWSQMLVCHARFKAERSSWYMLAMQ
eukprot:1137790-Pelagomonas_calceolata.AAC.3